VVFKLFLFLQFYQLSSISQSASVSYKLVSRGGVLIGNIQTPHCEYVPMTNILLQNSTHTPGSREEDLLCGCEHLIVSDGHDSSIEVT
jgi:hypothetical protein